MPAGLSGIFITVCLHWQSPANPCRKTLTGETSAQNISHGPVYPAGFAEYIIVGPHTNTPCTAPMKNSKSKWLAYTVLVGLIPILARLLVWLIVNSDIVLPFAATDFVAFGLVLHISNINELEHVSAQSKPWKTVQNGISVIFIALYSVLFAVILLAEKNPTLINANSLLACVVALAVTSFVLSLSVLHRLTATSRGTP